MKHALKCNRCGGTTNVFTDAIYNADTNTYTLTPICINCKKSDLEIEHVVSWEKELNDLESSVADQLIKNKFSNIKFKNNAREILIELMRKYSVRCVFEICTLLNSNFNAHLISEKCKQKLTR